MRGNVAEYRDFVMSRRWEVVVNHCLQTWTTDALLDRIASLRCPAILVTHGLSGWDSATFHRYYRRIHTPLHQYAAWVTVSNLPEEAELANEAGTKGPVTIQNGIDLDEWSGASNGLRQRWGFAGRPWVVNVSNHSPVKGHGRYFRLAEQFPAGQMRFSLIGGTYPMARWSLGRTGLRGGCFYRCCARALLSGRVDLRTNVPRQDVVSAIKEADVFVCTSTREANPIVLLESMAAGTPWIAFDVGSVRHNRGGCVVADEEELASTLSRLLSQPAVRRELAADGTRRVREQHSWDAIAKQYLALYSETLERRRP
jgi:glycosyltransferase involved in cell wall biosynthesis